MTALQSDSTTAKRAMLAVLYAEIRGFTRMSEILEPAVVIARVAEFFAVVAAAVEGHEGHVCSKLNDATKRATAPRCSSSRDCFGQRLA